MPGVFRYLRDMREADRRTILERQTVEEWQAENARWWAGMSARIGWSRRIYLTLFLTACVCFLLAAAGVGGDTRWAFFLGGVVLLGATQLV